MAKKIMMSKDPYVNARGLESGNILFFPTIPFAFPQEEIDFLLEQRQSKAKGHKNIAYKPGSGRLSNHLGNEERLKEILKSYSERVSQFLTGALKPYATAWKIDFTSFRPFQEKGRDLRLRARNDLLHVDAFPTRPMHGDRILRFFTNINPKESRNWITSAPFGELVEQFKEVPFPRPVGYSLFSRLERKMKLLMQGAGVKIPLRSPYDAFMLRMHNFLKENADFQKNCHKDYWEFPPNSCWAVFTDQVSHAALSGQYALEQTFLIPVPALLFPDKSPLRILERLSGRNLVDHALA